MAAGVLLVLGGCAAPQRRTAPPPPITQTHSHRPRPIPRYVPRPTPPRPAPRPEVQRTPVPQPPKRPIDATIVVDAGHGGKDPGARGLSARPEKSITLEIATKLASALRQRGARVILTRAGDRFISLDGRAAMADRYRADLFVSIHADSARRASAAGTTVYVARGSLPQSRHAARLIDAALREAGLTTRGVDKAGYRVLVGHSRPAVLIECGFLTNRAEAQRLNDSAYQSRLVAAIVEGLADYFNL